MAPARPVEAKSSADEIHEDAQSPEGFETKMLVVMLFLTGALVIYQSHRHSRIATELLLRLGNLRADVQFEVAQKQELQTEVRELKRSNAEAKSESAIRFMESTQLNQELAKVRAKVQAMIDADPEIETKANDWAKERARHLAEIELQEVARANERRLQAQGQAKLECLLAEMKRG